MGINSLVAEPPTASKTQTQYHVILMHRTQMEHNIGHRLAIDGGLPFISGNPDGWRTYSDSKFPNSWVMAALKESVAQQWYDALKARLPEAYIVPPTKVEVILESEKTN